MSGALAQSWILREHLSWSLPDPLEDDEESLALLLSSSLELLLEDDDDDDMISISTIVLRAEGNEAAPVAPSSGVETH